MKLTTQQIMQILPMDEHLRFELRATFDAATPEKQFRLAALLFKQYYSYLDLRVRQNLELAMADENFNPNGPDFYNELRKRTEKEIYAETSDKLSTKQLAAVREMMGRLQQEIAAVKKDTGSENSDSTQ